LSSNTSTEDSGLFGHILPLFGSILVNPSNWLHVKAAPARIWHEWLTSKAGLDAITSYRINGEQLFFPPRQAGTN
jgi:ABC-type tungstate transport system permease subunit